jgi:hypothetical protein
VSDEDNSIALRPTIGSRRVSMLVAAPVVAGCALLGSLIGTTHPLQSMFPAAPGGGELGDLRLASVKLVEAPPEAVEPPSGAHGAPPPGAAHGVTASGDTAHASASAPSSVLAVNTESVDRPLSPGGSGDVATTQRDQPEFVPAEGAPRVTTQSHRQARAKRLRRMLGRHTRPKPPGAQVDAFISSILPIK